MKAIRRSWPGRPAHACSRDVFPLPAAAEMQLDHQDLVTTSHLPGGEPGHAQEPIRSVHDRKEKPMTSLFGVVSTEVAA
jgi:hypothetical protein